VTEDDFSPRDGSYDPAEKARELAEAYADAAERIALRLAEAAATGERAFETMARSITRSLASIAIERLIVDPLERAADRLAKDLAKSAPSLFLEGLFAGVSGGAPSGGVIPGKARGGAVHGGRSYVVGERGPELFTPPSAGRVTPQASGGVTVNVYASGDGAPAARRTERQISRGLARSVRRGLER